MKHLAAASVGDYALVAPHAGAWVETWITRLIHIIHIVAPHAGAWVETSSLNRSQFRLESPPTRGRGLKRQPDNFRLLEEGRPPRGGVG